MNISLLLAVSALICCHSHANDSTESVVESLTPASTFSAVSGEGKWVRRYSGKTFGRITIPRTAKEVFVSLSTGHAVTIPTDAPSHKFGGYFADVGSYICTSTPLFAATYSNFSISGFNGRQTGYCKENHHEGRIQRKYFNGSVAILAVYYR